MAPVAATLAVMAVQTTAAPAGAEASWTVREQIEVPVMAADHVVGGLGLGLALERGSFGLDAEAQFLPVVVCDASCGSAYTGGVGISATPGAWRGVTSHLALLAEYFAHPAFHQYVPALSTRAGVRWLSGGTGLSLDAALSFAAADNFEVGGFARNKVLGWAVPELILGIWF